MNQSTEKVEVWWSKALNAITTISGILLGIGAIAWLGLSLMPYKKKEEE